MTEKECISLDELLNEFGDDIENESNILMENMGNFCSSLGFLTKNLNSMDDKKTLKLLKLIRNLLKTINQNTYSIVEKLSKNDENFSYKDFLNNYEEEAMFSNKEFKPSN